MDSRVQGATTQPRPTRQLFSNFPRSQRTRAPLPFPHSPDVSRSCLRIIRAREPMRRPWTCMACPVPSPAKRARGTCPLFHINIRHALPSLCRKSGLVARNFVSMAFPSCRRRCHLRSCIPTPTKTMDLQRSLLGNPPLWIDSPIARMFAGKHRVRMHTPQARPDTRCLKQT